MTINKPSEECETLLRAIQLGIVKVTRCPERDRDLSNLAWKTETGWVIWIFDDCDSFDYVDSVESPHGEHFEYEEIPEYMVSDWDTFVGRFDWENRGSKVYRS